jgi:NAD(P)-dependent dehydrogenase (short-subunit alcohol dehydrogenase family)
MTHLEGRVAIVTGSSRGIGKAIAIELARQGADIVVCARTEQSSDDAPGSIGETAEAVRATGRKALALRVDVTSDGDLEGLVEQTVAEFGKIDVLVNNAGVLGGGGPFIGGDPNLLDLFYRTNVRAPYVAAQLVGAKMVEAGGGAIINISSGLAKMPPPPAGDPGQGGGGGHGGPGAVYGLSKAALDRWATGVAAELKAQRIAIINVYPGMTITERMERRLPPGVDTSRMERPETTGKAVAFLCRDAMAYTGQIVEARALVDEQGL